ncbi:MAG: hypothetical protein KDD14_24720, partial [Saprospiraceae bacterium]|nr:hypothetical protein [Saprospiraceae bacterium]
NVLLEMNERYIADLNREYNAISELDSLNAFTSVLQDRFIDSERNLNFIGRIKDICKSDSLFTITVWNKDFFNDRDYMALISLSAESLNEFRAKFREAGSVDEISFIVNVSEIISYPLQLKSNIEHSSDDIYTYLSLDSDFSLIIFKGSLIDYYIMKTEEQ